MQRKEGRDKHRFVIEPRDGESAPDEGDLEFGSWVHAAGVMEWADGNFGLGPPSDRQQLHGRISGPARPPMEVADHPPQALLHPLQPLPPGPVWPVTGDSGPLRSPLKRVRIACSHRLACSSQTPGIFRREGQGAWLSLGSQRVEVCRSRMRGAKALLHPAPRPRPPHVAADARRPRPQHNDTRKPWKPPKSHRLAGWRTRPKVLTERLGCVRSPIPVIDQGRDGI